MAMRPIDFAGAMAVDGYGPGFFRIGGAVHRGPVLVTRTAVAAWGGLDDPAPLVALAAQADVLFLGLGADPGRAPAAIAAALDAAGLMVEAMATPAAARTYNVTLAEGRRVACALLPV